MFVRDDGDLIDLVRKGQGVLNILSLSGVQQEMDDKILSLRPETGEEQNSVAI